MITQVMQANDQERLRFAEKLARDDDVTKYIYELVFANDQLRAHVSELVREVAAARDEIVHLQTLLEKFNG